MGHPYHLHFEICGLETLFSEDKRDYWRGVFGPVPCILGYAALSLLVDRVTYRAAQARRMWL